jgi:hypothetical protein
MDEIFWGSDSSRRDEVSTTDHGKQSTQSVRLTPSLHVRKIYEQPGGMLVIPASDDKTVSTQPNRQTPGGSGSVRKKS